MKKLWILVLLLAAPAHAGMGVPGGDERATANEVWTVVYLVRYLYAAKVNNAGDDTREVDCVIDRFLEVLKKVQEEDGAISRNQLHLHAGFAFRGIDRSPFDWCTMDKVERDLK